MTNEITNEELTRLKVLAEAATPGPWVSCHHQVAADDGGLIAEFSSTTGRYESEKMNRNYVAAASPDVILALIAKVESLAADAERLDWLEKSKTSLSEFYEEARIPKTDGSGGYCKELVFKGWVAGITDEPFATPRAAIDFYMAKDKA